MNKYCKNSALTKHPLNPLTRAMRLQTRKLSSAALTASVVFSIVHLPQSIAQDDSSGIVLEEIIVTAQKRSESLQDVPISIQAYNSEKLDQLNISDFDDYASLLPSVSYVSLGPGNSQVYMRGVSDGTNGTSTASGATPSVAIYLDEQPVTSIGRNLDVHIYDIERVEALAGPQGSLYGASSQSGTLRIITKKADTSEFSAGIDLGASTTHKGEPSHSIEGFVNIPIVEDKAAIRLVGWRTDDGGYIDNVLRTQTFNAGTAFTTDNSEFTKDDFNESEKTGFRAALRIDLDENWTVTVGHSAQELESVGVWDHDPDKIGDLEVARFFDDSNTDKFNQSSIEIEANIGEFEFIYAGSYLDREVDYELDYSSYSVDADSYIKYYVCDYDAGNFTNCGDPRIQFRDESRYKRLNHEVRIQSPAEDRLRYIVGAFYEDSTHDYELSWEIPGIRPGKTVASGLEQDNMLPDPRNPNGLTLPSGSNLPPNTYFFTDQSRLDEQLAFFGEVSFDINDSLTATIGGRYFDAETEIEGYAGSAIFSPFTVLGAGNGGADISVQEDGFLYKANLTYQINSDVMVYGTFSEGFRPGGANRDPKGGIPKTYDADFVDNFELGWKATLMDGRMRFNGAAYWMVWEDMQLSRLDVKTGSFLVFTENVSESEIKGVEADLTFLAAEGLTLVSAISYNQAKLTKDFTLLSDSTQVLAAEGTELPFVPELKFTQTARYEFAWIGYDMNLQAVYNYTDTSYSDLIVDDREEQGSFNFANLSFGIDAESWSASMYVNNVTDERPEIFINSVDEDTRVTTSRPRSVGVDFGYRF